MKIEFNIVKTFTLKDIQKMYGIHYNTLKTRCKELNIEQFGNGYKITKEQLESILNFKSLDYRLEVIHHTTEWFFIPSKINFLTLEQLT